MGTEMKANISDDEEDLEALRLAALSSLKKKSEMPPQIQHFPNDQKQNHPYNKGSFRGGKRRFFPGSSGRVGRNGHFNNQSRNSNLISIPTTNEQSDDTLPARKSSKFIPKNDVPKLVRPQDRYASTNNQEVENEGPSSKFDRYDDNSNSESEDDESCGGNLERSDSLEALMEELDAEIQGEPKKDKKEKVKVKKSTELKDTCEEVVLEPSSKNAEVIIHDKDSSENKADLDVQISSSSDTVEKSKLPERVFVKKNQRSPGQRNLNKRRLNGRVFNPEVPYVPSNPIIVPPNPQFMNPMQSSQFTTVYNTVPSFPGHEIFPVSVPPPNFIPNPSVLSLDGLQAGFGVPPLHPLVIDTPSSFSAIPMGPLSPRSAAFVLQNRAIVEKRKRSPRRSYSRSPSPASHRLRYSKSPPLRRSPTPPRRSLTPARRSLSPSRRSLSPRPIRRSLSPYRRQREKSPRRNSPRRSPKRYRDSPKRSPKRSRESPKKTKETRRTPVKDRLGARTKNEDKDLKKKEEPVANPIKKEDLKPVDPVLEARKKKFESREIQVKGGVIRLKPKEEKRSDDEAAPVQTTITAEPLERPAVKEESTRIVLLPKNEETLESPHVNQLEEAMNELEMLLKDEDALELTAKVEELFTDEETDQENEGRFKVKKGAMPDDKPAPAPFKKLLNTSAEKKRDGKGKWSFEESKREPKTKKLKKEPLTNPIENRKIEIKIRNPGKYEKNSERTPIGSGRNVELALKEEDESEPEIVVENEDDDEEEEQIAASKEGDLRAQLSRKRAERQNKLPAVEGVQSRLIQSALEGAVFKKKKSKKKDRESKDVKLPIHLRLGLAHETDLFAETASENLPRKKSKKRKHSSLDQV